MWWRWTSHSITNIAEFKYEQQQNQKSDDFGNHHNINIEVVVAILGAILCDVLRRAVFSFVQSLLFFSVETLSGSEPFYAGEFEDGVRAVRILYEYGQIVIPLSIAVRARALCVKDGKIFGLDLLLLHI